jgi:phospholipid/cholesterol/gamma-HCH transport system permease protein
MGGFFAATGSLGFSPAAYLRSTVYLFEPFDSASSLVNGAASCGFVAIMGCYLGMHIDRGAFRVRHVTKSAVETATVLLLAVNFVLTAVIFAL